jgi:hypothetical protein
VYRIVLPQARQEQHFDEVLDSHEFLANNRNDSCNGADVVNRKQEYIVYEEVSPTDL